MAAEELLTADGPRRTPFPQVGKEKPRMPPAVGAVAGALGPLPGPSGLPVPLPELGGRWRKDRARSDSMDTMCEVRSSSPFSPE